MLMQIKLMKKFIQWLAKVFNANITIEKIVIKEVVKEVPIVKEVTKYLTNGTIKGDVNVVGNLSVDGSITATGGITCLKD